MKEPIWTKGFIALFFTNISIFIVFYALVAALPLYAIGALQRTDDEAGLLLSIFLLSAIIVRPFTGKILNYLTLYAQEKNILPFVSAFYFVVAIGMLAPRPWTGKIFDEKGPKYVIIPGLLFFAIGIALLALMQTSFLFLIAGIFIGIGYGAVVPSMQTVAVQSTNVNRSSYATATFFTFFDLGIAVGSYVLGIIAFHSNYQTMYFTGVGFVIFALLCYIFSMRTHQKARN